MATTHRTIVESKLYAESKAGLPVTCERLDEILNGILWVLARKPDFFPRVPGTIIHRAKTEKFPNLPVFRIWFTYDADEVCLQLIECAEQEDD